MSRRERSPSVWASVSVSLFLTAVLLLNAVPVAHAESFSTTAGYLDGSNNFIPGNVVPLGDGAADQANLMTPCSSGCAPITFDLYAGGGCTGTLLLTQTQPVSSSPGTVQFPLSMGYKGFAGSYSWQVTWVDPTGATEVSNCEDFTIGTVGPSVPQFPLGLAVLFALVVPALLVLKNKFLLQKTTAL